MLMLGGRLFVRGRLIVQQSGQSRNKVGIVMPRDILLGPN
jgi:hypothetical protein